MRMALAAVIGVLLTSASCAAPPAPSTQIIPLDLTGAHPTAELVFEGHAPIAAIFDTGAGATLFATQTAKDLGLPNEGTIQIGSPGASAPLTGYRTTIRSARLGSAEFRNAFAVVADIPSAMPKLSAVVSPNVFLGRLVRFEFAASRAVIAEKSAAAIPTGPGYAYGGEQGHPLPVVTVEIGDLKVTAHADSGSRHGLGFPLELAKKLPLVGPLVPAPDVRLLGGTHKAFTGKIAGVVRVGPLALQDPDVGFVEGVPIANVGIKVLKHLTLVLDPAERRDWVLLP